MLHNEIVHIPTGPNLRSNLKEVTVEAEEVRTGNRHYASYMLGKIQTHFLALNTFRNGANDYVEAML
jgi:hypothetical protein